MRWGAGSDIKICIESVVEGRVVLYSTTVFFQMGDIMYIGNE